MNSLSRHWLIYLIIALSSMILVFLLSFFAGRNNETYQAKRLTPMALMMTTGQIRLQQVVKDSPSVSYMLLIEENKEAMYVVSLEEQRAIDAQKWLAKYDKQGNLVALKEQADDVKLVEHSAELEALLGANNAFVSYNQQRLQAMVQDGSKFVLSEVKRAPYF